MVVDSTDPEYRTVVAGPEYRANGFYQFLWGKHYRKEWITPVKVPVIHLDKEKGGLIAIEQGGGRQTLTLRLKDANGKEYVLRSIDKDYGTILPEIAKETFVENLAKDQVSMAHPYASLTIPGMISAAGIFHTNPRIVFVPYTPSLGEFNASFANTLCLFEERPVGYQGDVPSFGFSEEVKGTENMYKKLFEENDHRVDQKAFVRARLFDMFVGDWGRHDDQWRWAQFDSADYKIYKPIPRDRDQVYTKFDGFLINKIVGSEELEHLQTFAYKIKNVKKYNFPARYIDRQLTNEVTRQEWVNIAKEIQQAETDNVIENSIRQMPPEVFPISGNELIAKLKSRRSQLVKYAEKYYRFLTKQVEVVGTEQSELFAIKKLPGNQVQLSLYDLNKEGRPKEKPFYSRIFNGDETNELRLYGLKGNDIYRVEGTDNSSIKLRIIGGIEKDSMINLSSSRIRYYDNPGNVIIGDVRSKISRDSSINSFDYDAFKYNVGYSLTSPSFTNTRGIFFRLGYTYTKQKWRKAPFGWQQMLALNYSFSNKSFGGDYIGIFNHAIGKWDLLINGHYDQKLRNFFYGAGNETLKTSNKAFYQVFTKEAQAAIGLNRVFANYHLFGFSGLFQSFKVNNDIDKFFYSNLLPTDPTIFNEKKFAGGQVNYLYYRVNNLVVPTKGFGFNATASYLQNLDQSNRSLYRYVTNLGFYLPFSRTISLASRSGGATVTGQPEFYQLNWLGGGQNLRGFNRQRFHGNTLFYNNNDLRWLPDVKGKIFSGKLGLAAFFDNGRVWSKNEKSDKWHFGYGGGVVIVPFNRISLAVYYGVSDDDSRIHIRLGRFF